MALRSQIFSFKETIHELRKKNAMLERQIERMGHRVVPAGVGDPAPSDQVPRREYIARVAAFHTDVMKYKIESMVSEVRAELEKVDNPPELDRILKGTCNALWLINDWGELAVSEMMSYRTLEEDNKEE